MIGKRDYVAEILSKQGRLHRRGSRWDVFARRIHPLVAGFRAVKALDSNVSWRNEWLKYGAIGYVAGMEGYFRILIANLIDHGDPYLSRVSGLREVKFSAEIVVAIQAGKVSLGQFISHLLPINGVSDINAHLSALIGQDFLQRYAAQPASEYNTTHVGKLHPKAIGEVEELFKLRHLYAHELATRLPVPVRRIERLISSAASFVWHTEEIASQEWLAY